MIIRTYRLSMLGPQFADRGVYPGTDYDKSVSFFKNTEACRVLERLDIPWKVRNGVHPEIIFIMTQDQFVLWKIAGGDQCCRMGAGVPMFFTSQIQMELNSCTVPGRPWQTSFDDGMVSFSRDNIQFSVYNDQAVVRGVLFPGYANAITPREGDSVLTTLLRFPIAGLAGLAGLGLRPLNNIAGG